jgi:hypothetical protein
MYAGAGRCDRMNGLNVGNASISFVPIVGSTDGKLTVDISLDKDTYYLEETHVYVGISEVPEFKGKPTFSPGQFGNANTITGQPESDQYRITVPASTSAGHIIVHASVCGQRGKFARRLMLRGHDNGL